MNKIHRFIDRCIIDEYANKNFRDGYSLDVDSVPPKEIHDLIEICMEHDTSLREMVLIEIQRLIDERLPEVEVDDRANSGLSLVRSFNGDAYLVRNSSFESGDAA